jgi:hypothetical protein
MEVLQLLWSRRCPLVNTPQLDYGAISSQPPLQNSNELTPPPVPVITSRHERHRQRRSSIVSSVFVAVETYLTCRYPETARNEMEGCGPSPCGLGQKPVVSACEHGNKASGLQKITGIS